VVVVVDGIDVVVVAEVVVVVAGDSVVGGDSVVVVPVAAVVDVVESAVSEGEHAEAKSITATSNLRIASQVRRSGFG
jgi:hypothetical protein